MGCGFCASPVGRPLIRTGRRFPMASSRGGSSMRVASSSFMAPPGSLSSADYRVVALDEGVGFCIHPALQPWDLAPCLPHSVASLCPRWRPFLSVPAFPREPHLVSLSASVSFGSRTWSSQEGWFYTWILSVKRKRKRRSFWEFSLFVKLTSLWLKGWVSSVLLV